MNKRLDGVRPYTSMPLMQNRQVTEEDRMTIISVFYDSDEGHKDILNREDLKVAVVSLFGYKPSKYEVNDMMKSLPHDALGMPLNIFLEIMSSKMATIDEDDYIRQVFVAFDRHCHSFLTIDDLKKAVGQVAPHLPAHAIESSFREIDRDGDGRVSYKDFEFMMKYSIKDGF